MKKKKKKLIFLFLLSFQFLSYSVCLFFHNVCRDRAQSSAVLPHFHSPHTLCESFVFSLSLQGEL